MDALFQITTRAYDLNDYVIIEKSLGGFRDILEQTEAGTKAYDIISENLVVRMRDLRRVFLGNSYAVKLVLRALVEIGEYSIRKSLSYVDIGKIMEIIELIPWQAINIGDSLALQDSVRAYGDLLAYMATSIYNKDYQSKLAKWYVLIGSYGLQLSDEYCQRIVLTSLKDHIVKDRIDYQIACQQAVIAVQANEYWELKEESVASFIESWPQSKITRFKSSAGISQP